MAYIHRAGLAGIYHPSHCSAAPAISPVIRARLLDLEAGAELAQGHVAAAERLAWQAAELRETGA